MAQRPRGWHADPSGKHELRWYDGERWTTAVMDDGVESRHDPRNARPPAAAAPPPPRGRLDSITAPARAPAQSGNGLAVAALVVGIVGALLGLIPLLFLLAWIGGALGVVFGLVGRRRASRGATGKGMATAGAVLGVVAIGLGIVGVVIVVNAVDDVDDALDAIDDPADPDSYELVAQGCAADPDLPGFWTASGTLTNMGDEAMTFVLDVEYLDPGTNDRVQQSGTTITALAAGQSAAWEASAPLPDGVSTAQCGVANVDSFPSG